jgi:hypothetical protein
MRRRFFSFFPSFPSLGVFLAFFAVTFVGDFGLFPPLVPLPALGASVAATCSLSLVSFFGGILVWDLRHRKRIRKKSEAQISPQRTASVAKERKDIGTGGLAWKMKRQENEEGFVGKWDQISQTAPKKNKARFFQKIQKLEFRVFFFPFFARK